MAPRPRPTDAELEILQVLWTRGPSTVREVHEALKPQTRGYTTILKLLQIMTDKDLVRCDASNRTHVFRARVPRGRMQSTLVRDLMDRAFSGSASSLVVRALSARKTSPEELAEIRALLDSLEPEES